MIFYNNIYLDVNIFRPVKKKMEAKNHQWSGDNPGKTLNKRTLISEVARPAFEEVLSRTEIITNAFKMTGLYPFNPLAVNRSKLLPGNKYQKHPDDTLPLEVVVDVAEEDVIPEEAVVLQTVPLSPELGPSMAPDLVETTESFSCINCAKDKLLSESVHHCHRVCQQCILGLAQSQADQGFHSVFCPCGDELSLEALKPLLPADLYRQLSELGAPSRPVSTNESFQLKTVKEMTREEKDTQLEKFEVVFLQKDQVKEFREVFEAGVRYECSSSLYLSWLPLKLDTMETEQEVLDRFFADKTPSNLEKKKTTRKVRKPDGSARFDPLSPEWREIWEDQDQAKKDKEEKKKETERRALERKEKKLNIEKKKEEKRKEKETRAKAKAPPSSAEPGIEESSLVSLPGPATRARPKGKPRGTPGQSLAKSGPPLPRPDSPPSQPPPNLPSSPLPSQPQPANVRKGGKRKTREQEGNLEDIFSRKRKK